MTKLRKLLTRAMNVEIRNHKYRHDARDSDYHFIPLYAPLGG